MGKMGTLNKKTIKQIKISIIYVLYVL